MEDMRSPAAGSGAVISPVHLQLSGNDYGIPHDFRRGRHAVHGKTDRICLCHPMMPASAAFKTSCAKCTTGRRSVFIDSAGQASPRDGRQLGAMTALHTHEHTIRRHVQGIFRNVAGHIIGQQANIAVMCAKATRPASQAVNRVIGHVIKIRTPAGGYRTVNRAPALALHLGSWSGKRKAAQH